MICSFEFLARCVRTRIPSEQTFSVVVRSAVAGFCGLVISIGTASRTRFSSRPDLAAISTPPSTLVSSWLAPGWGSAQKVTGTNQKFSDDDFLESTDAGYSHCSSPVPQPHPPYVVSVHIALGRHSSITLQSMRSLQDRSAQGRNS